MTKDIEYTLSLLKVFEDYDIIFDDLNNLVWQKRSEFNNDWTPICEAYNNIKWENIQSMVLPQNLRYLVPYQKSKKLIEKDRQKYLEKLKRAGIKI